MYYAIAEVVSGEIRAVARCAAEAARHWLPGTVWGKGLAEADARNSARDTAARLRQAARKVAA